MKSHNSATPNGDVLAPLTAAQLVSLLTLDARVLQLGYCPTVLAPHHVLHHIGRGRLRGQLLETTVCTWHGARGNHRQRVGELQRGLLLDVHVSRGLRRSSRNSLCAGFEEFTDSDVDLATLAANLLAYFALADAALPLFLQVHQNWKRGYTPVQVVPLVRSEALARRLLNHLLQTFRWDLDAQPDTTTLTQLTRPAAKAADFPAGTAAGDEAALPPAGQRGYYAQYAPVRGLFGQAA